nr:MAG TPA: hypothetical protein [Inoviridae sp.]
MRRWAFRIVRQQGKLIFPTHHINPTPARIRIRLRNAGVLAFSHASPSPPIRIERQAVFCPIAAGFRLD